MKTVLITGAKGFIGRNLSARLSAAADVRLVRYDMDSPAADLDEGLATADVVFHLAGVNRPKDVEEYDSGNAGFTGEICQRLREIKRKPKMVMTSSIQAEMDNPYGVSKRKAEESLVQYSRETGAIVSIYRLKNVFGKWCRPNYNSVTATFCHNIAHDLPISISDPAREIDLVYVDDVVEALVRELNDLTHGPTDGFVPDFIPTYRISLGDLAGRIQTFHEMRESLLTPDFSVRFNQCLYSTYLSYLEPRSLEYGLDIKADQRGSLAEFIKSPYFGQIFVSRTLPGIERGNHYHHTKTEKFLVLSGEGLIQMRHIEGDEIVEYRVKGEDYRVVNIPPGHTHSIKNVGNVEMMTLFWASEMFDPDRPDTYYLEV